MRTAKRTIAAAIVIASGFVCLAAIELCETTVHLKPNPISRFDAMKAGKLASGTGTKLEDVEIASRDGIHLKGWFFRSARFEADPVILLHGQGDNRKGMLGLSGFLLRAGYSVLIPDIRAHGDSGGDLASYGYREASDVNQWVNWLQKHAPSPCVYGLGRSMGAAILLQVLPEQHHICSAVADSPFSSLRDVGIYRTRLIFGSRTYVPELIVSVGFAYASLRYGLDFNQVSPQDAVARTTAPVLLIHGTADDSIPSSESQIILSRGSGRIEFWRVSGVGHIGSYSAHPAEFEARVLGWFQRFAQSKRLSTRLAN